MRNIRVILLLAILFATPSFVWARAGGSHGGVSSSSSSSSHSSVSMPSFGSTTSGVLPRATSSFPASPLSGLVIIVVIVAVGVVIVLVNSRRNQYTNISDNLQDIGTMGRGELGGISENAESKDLSELTQKDAGFNEQKFKELVNIAFFKIQNAWGDGDMARARAFISDGIMKRFSMQLDAYKRDGRKNILDGLSLDRVEIEGYRSDEKYDYIGALVTATAKDYTVNKDEKIVDGSKDDYITWTELWMFMRSKNAQTAEEEKGVFADKCPNCGASIAVNALGKCDYCGTEVTKWEFDWVLSEIVQID